MVEAIHFLMKRWLKSKYLLLVSGVIGLLVVTLLIVNSTQSGATQQELQETFKNRKETVQLLINSTLTKESIIGLTTEEQQSLESLLLKEEYLNEILSKINDGNLHIATEQLSYINEYEKFIMFQPITYLNNSVLTVEKKKAEEMIKQDLSYSEQLTPFKTALFTKQLFQILFSPIAAFLILLIFCYTYISDRENRIFEFFKMNSLSNRAINYGYFVPLILMTVIYIFIACLLSLLPTLLTGNIKTLFYPLEVAVNTEIILVPVWKWLVFIPLGWGIFVSILLLLMVCLFKQRATLGLLFSLISLPVLICYMISLNVGFQIANPIHLIVSYESNLLSTNRFIIYLLGMLFLLFICFIISYVTISTKNITLKLPEVNLTKKQYQLAGKFKLLQFEHLKKKRKGHLLITFLLLFGCIGGTVAVVNQQFQAIPTTVLKTIERFQNAIIENRTHWELVSAEFELEKEMQRQIQEQSGEEPQITPENPYTTMVVELNNQYEILEKLKDKIHFPDFPQKFREALSSIDSPTYKDMDSALWTVTLMGSEEQQNILDDKGISPWPLGNKWISGYDTPNNAISNEHYELLKLFQERNTKYDNSSLFSVYKYLDWNVMLFVLLLFILLLWTTISEESRPNLTINFLVTKPISFTSIYITKWVYNLLIAYSLLFISSALIFLIATFIGGLGEADYPILVYSTDRLEDHYFFSVANNSYFYFESLATLIAKSGILIFSQIFFLNCLFSFVGRVTKNQYASIVITLIIAGVGYSLGNQYIEMSSIYNPFVYFDTWNIVDGWKSIEASNGKVNFHNGTVILLISGSLLFCTGLLFRKKVTS